MREQTAGFIMILDSPNCQASGYKRFPRSIIFLLFSFKCVFYYKILVRIQLFPSLIGLWIALIETLLQFSYLIMSLSFFRGIYYKLFINSSIFYFLSIFDFSSSSSYWSKSFRFILFEFFLLIYRLLQKF